MIILKKKGKPTIITLESSTEEYHLDAICSLYSSTACPDEDCDTVKETTDFALEIEEKLK